MPKNNDDLISRQTAIDALGGNEPVGDPSKMDDDDVVKMWERIRIINIINKLPSAQPKPRKGKWIPIGEIDADGNQYYNCSACQCGETHSPKVEVYYCWNCGADMREEKTDD